MSMNSVEFAKDMADIAIECFVQNMRVVFWGYYPDVLTNLVRSGVLHRMSFKLVDDRRVYIGKQVLKTRVEHPDNIRSFKPDVVIILDNSRSMKIYETIVEKYCIKPTKVFVTKQMWQQEDYFDDSLYLECINSIPSNIRGGLSIPKVYIHLFQALKYVIENNVIGDVLNIGIYQGWSMYFICCLLKKLGNDSKKVLGFDSFKGIHGRHKLDCFCEHQTKLGKTAQNFFRDTSLELCQMNLSDFDNFAIIDGNICDTIKKIKNRKVALALFDMDDYSATKEALPEVYNSLVKGGIILHDHFTFDSLCGGACIGQRLAMRKFLRIHPMFNLCGTNVFLKI